MNVNAKEPRKRKKGKEKVKETEEKAKEGKEKTKKGKEKVKTGKEKPIEGRKEKAKEKENPLLNNPIESEILNCSEYQSKGKKDFMLLFFCQKKKYLM